MIIDRKEFFKISPSSLKKLINIYIFKELLPLKWDCTDKNPLKNIRNLIDACNGKLQIYDNAEEVFENLKLLQCFPGSDEKYGFNIAEVYGYDPSEYKSMKRTAYYYKRDCFVALQMAISVSPLRKFETEVSCATIAAYLKMRERLFPTQHEMTTFCPITFTQLAIRIGKINKDFNKIQETLDLQMEFEDYTFEEMFTQWITISKYFATDKAQDSLQEVLRVFVARIPIKANEDVYKRMFAWSKIVVEELEKFIEDNKPFFYSKAVSGEKTCTPIVRLFEDKTCKIIMAHELLLVMKQEQMDVSSFEKEVLALPPLATFTYQEVAARVSKTDFRKIEFVITGITSAGYLATPIPTITPGGYCVLAYYFFYNLVTNMITGKKMFQKMDPSQFHLVEEFFNFFDDYFDLTKGVTFIDLKDVDEINEKMETLYNSLTNSCEEPTEIRDMGKKGFTNEDFINELKRLKLDTIFPEICVQSKFYFEKIDDKKRSNTLSTYGACGLMDHLQIDGLARRIPKISEFIHSQLWCTQEMIGYCCKICCKICKTEPVEVESSSKNSSHAELEESMEIGLESESRSNEKETQEPSNDPKLLKSKKSKKSRQSEQTFTKPEEKESNACPKCFRASEYNIKLREDLRLEKIETKHLRKSLKQSQQESEEKSQKIAEKNEEIQLLKAQLQAQQVVIAKNLENQILVKNSPIPVKEMIPGRSAEETEKVHRILDEMLDTQKILETENPMSKITKMTSKLIETSQNRENKIIAKREFIYFERQIRGYTKEVENRIKIIRSNQQIRSDQLPELRDFPKFCDEFLKAYKDTFKEKAPLICAQLLKIPEFSNELDDNECLVCLDDMKDEHETLKCLDCKRKYHTGCAQKWFKVKRICPTCDAGLLDDNEFPALS